MGRKERIQEVRTKIIRITQQWIEILAVILVTIRVVQAMLGGHTRKNRREMKVILWKQVLRSKGGLDEHQLQEMS